MLFLGRIGGPRAAGRLKEMLDREQPRLVRAAAASGLEQISTKEALGAAAEFRKVMRHDPSAFDAAERLAALG